MVKRRKRRDIKKTTNNAVVISLIALLVLAAAYSILSAYLQKNPAYYFPAPPITITPEIKTLSTQVGDNALIINISSPEIIATGIFRLKIPQGIEIDPERIDGSGAFQTKNIRRKIEQIRIDYFDLNPSYNYGEIIIPFKADSPGRYIFEILGETKFMNKAGDKIELDTKLFEINIEMFNFSFYAVSKNRPDEKNKIIAGDLAEVTIEAPIGGNFLFELKIKQDENVISTKTASSENQGIYTWENALDSYIDPSKMEYCNAGKLNVSVTLDYNGNKAEKEIEVSIIKPKLEEIYRLVDEYFATQDESLIPRIYYMVGSYLNCP